MILYFADRKFNILGQASTGLPSGLAVIDDVKIGDVETGVSSFECKVRFDRKTRLDVEAWATAGNYILRSDGDENEFFTIIESETDTSKNAVSIYAEDAGLDLLNEVVAEYEADKAYTLNEYIDMFAYDSGFRIGTNEAAGLSKQLKFESDETVTARIANIAKQFGDFEVSYTFKVKGLKITNKYINIFKKRGQELGVQLRLNKDIDSIITTKSVANLATCLRCTGGTPDGAENPITLKGYEYDDGDFYVQKETGCLMSRKALAKWSRYIWVDEPNKNQGYQGHIVKLFNFDTDSQATLCAEALKELKAICDVAINFEVDFAKLPDNIRIGDRVNIIDEAGKLYLSTRLLQLKKSVANNTAEAVLGEHIIKGSGIHQKVIDLAKQFAATAKSSARALSIANAAQVDATAAKNQADTALDNANKAQQAATEAVTAAQTATQSATEATQKANEAQAAVDAVEKSVEEMEEGINSAQQAAQSAEEKANTAQTKATEAEQAAAQAVADAADASASAQVANEKATTAITNAETAQETAEQAKTEANTAKATADAAKLDAQKANEDIASLGDRLTTVTHTMEADYARKTDLTETEASLQTQISQNAAQIQSTARKVQSVDETANNAAVQAQAAFLTAEQAQAQAQQAQTAADEAQAAADTAQDRADSAQAEADTAKANADEAQALLDSAEADLAQAEADLAAAQAREDATAEEIAEAQEAVTAAQTAADKAKADADAAAETAAEAQVEADTAVAEATEAQAVADQAAQTALNAQMAAEAVEDSAAAKAQAAADKAAQDAATAQSTADTAKDNATNAQNTADAAASAAASAQKTADDADAKAAQAEADLAAAQQNLADVTSRVGATEADIQVAKDAVDAAQAAADKAQADAEMAQNAADAAQTDAANAQTAADNAKTAADNAQAEADAAKQAADNAQAAVDALAVRVTTAETKITQNAEAIQLRATKTEVAETLAGYSTTEEMEAALTVKANEINSTVEAKFTGLQIGGRNLYTGTADFSGEDWLNIASWSDAEEFDSYGNKVLKRSHQWTGLSQYVHMKAGDSCVLSANIRGDGASTYRFYVTEYDESGDVLATASPGPEGVAPVSETRMSSAAYTVQNNCRLYFRLENSINGSTIWVSSIKLEKGNKATDWTPAPEDMASAEDLEAVEAEVKSEIKQTVDSITATVSRDYEKTASRGEQLVTNGNGQLGTNYNWAALEKDTPRHMALQFDGSVSNNSPGSFTYSTPSKYVVAFSDEFIPINTNKEYTLRADFKSANGLATINGFLSFYDVDKKQVSCGNYYYIVGTLTTLAQDLKNGDTVIHLTDVSGWQYLLNAVNVMFWNYTNSFGYTYPAETYTRNYAAIPNTSGTIADGAIDTATNTITLKTAWTGGTIPAGTEVSQGRSGATYKYLFVEKAGVPTEWTTYSGSIRGVDLTGNSGSKMFPCGTAYAKVGILWNLNAANDQLWVTNITVQDTTADTDLSSRLTSAETRITQTESKIALTATKKELTEAVNGIEVGGRNLLLNSGEEKQSSSYYIGAYEPSSFLISGDEYTISICVTPAEGVTRIHFYLSGGYTNLGQLPVSGTEKQLLTKTFVAEYYDGRTPDVLERYGLIELYRLPNSDAITGATTIHWVKVEKGNKPTDWTPAPEDMATADDVAEVSEDIVAVTESVAALDIKAGEIAASVTEVEKTTTEALDSLNDSVNSLSQEVSAKMTAEAVEVQIKTAMESGTSKVVTSTGYTFDDEGLTVEKSGSEMKTQITDNGMTVYQNDEAVLTANNKGVDAKNLHATTYLIVGENSRFEDYGSGRTGCFWIGGAS